MSRKRRSSGNGLEAVGGTKVGAAGGSFDLGPRHYYACSGNVPIEEFVNARMYAISFKRIHDEWVALGKPELDTTHWPRVIGHPGIPTSPDQFGNVAAYYERKIFANIELDAKGQKAQTDRPMSEFVFTMIILTCIITSDLFVYRERIKNPDLTERTRRKLWNRDFTTFIREILYYFDGERKVCDRLGPHHCAGPLMWGEAYYTPLDGLMEEFNVQVQVFQNLFPNFGHYSALCANAESTPPPRWRSPSDPPPEPFVLSSLGGPFSSDGGMPFTFTFPLDSTSTSSSSLAGATANTGPDAGSATANGPEPGLPAHPEPSERAIQIHRLNWDPNAARTLEGLGAGQDAIHFADGALFSAIEVGAEQRGDDGDESDLPEAKHFIVTNMPSDLTPNQRELFLAHVNQAMRSDVPLEAVTKYIDSALKISEANENSNGRRASEMTLTELRPSQRPRLLDSDMTFGLGPLLVSGPLPPVLERQLLQHKESDYSRHFGSGSSGSSHNSSGVFATPQDQKPPQPSMSQGAASFPLFTEAELQGGPSRAGVDRGEGSSRQAHHSLDGALLPHHSLYHTTSPLGPTAALSTVPSVLSHTHQTSSAGSGTSQVSSASSAAVPLPISSSEQPASSLYTALQYPPNSIFSTLDSAGVDADLGGANEADLDSRKTSRAERNRLKMKAYHKRVMQQREVLTNVLADLRVAVGPPPLSSLDTMAQDGGRRSRPGSISNASQMGIPGRASGHGSDKVSMSNSESPGATGGANANTNGSGTSHRNKQKQESKARLRRQEIEQVYHLGLYSEYASAHLEDNGFGGPRTDRGLADLWSSDVLRDRVHAREIAKTIVHILQRHRSSWEALVSVEQRLLTEVLRMRNAEDAQGMEQESHKVIRALIQRLEYDYTEAGGVGVVGHGTGGQVTGGHVGSGMAGPSELYQTQIQPQHHHPQATPWSQTQAMGGGEAEPVVLLTTDRLARYQVPAPGPVHAPGHAPGPSLPARARDVGYYNPPPAV